MSEIRADHRLASSRALVPASRAPSEQISAEHGRLGWLDLLRVVGLTLVVLVHTVEQVFGGMFAGNPTGHWGTLEDRLAQWAPIDGFGPLTPLVNALRWVGWLGDHGVSLFVIASGAALAWSAAARGDRLAFGSFLRRRVGRLYPLWIAVHLLLLVAIWAGAVGMNPVAFLTSLAGLRVTPDAVYYGVPAWWYFTLAIQLSLLFPLLLRLMRRCGPGRFLLVVGGATLAVRLVGLLALAGTESVDVWSRGIVGITRVPEFALGMALATWWCSDPQRASSVLGARRTQLACLGAVLAGILASFTLVGMTVAFLLVGAGLTGLVIGHALRRGRAVTTGAVVRWIAQHSYSIFLAHPLLIIVLVPHGLDDGTATLIGIGLAIPLSVVVAIGLDWSVATASRLVRRVLARRPAPAA